MSVPYNGKTTQAEISEASVSQALASIGSFLPICSAPSGSALGALLVSGSPRLGAMRAALVANAVSAAKQSTGDCGGTLTYPELSGSSGTQSGTFKFDNYCTTSSSNRMTINGELSFEASGGSGGLTGLKANAPGLTVTVADSGGTTLETASLGFAGFEYSAAGTTSTIKLSTLVATATKGGVTKGIKIENLSFTTVDTASGGNQVTGSVRFYLSDSGYTDISIDSTNPVVLDSSDQPVAGGKVHIAGANNTSATLTLTGSSPATFSTEVNGAPSTATLTCSADTTLPTL